MVVASLWGAAVGALPGGASVPPVLAPAPGPDGAVGAVAPGFIRTPLVLGMKPEALARMTAPIPLGRLGEPDEIAHAVSFIFENDLFTGRTLEVDAGLRM